MFLITIRTSTHGTITRELQTSGQCEALRDEYEGFASVESVTVTEDGSPVDWLCWSRDEG